jgi:hypothetical protein
MRYGFIREHVKGCHAKIYCSSASRGSMRSATCLIMSGFARIFYYAWFIPAICANTISFCHLSYPILGFSLFCGRISPSPAIPLPVSSSHFPLLAHFSCFPLHFHPPTALPPRTPRNFAQPAFCSLPIPHGT